MFSGKTVYILGAGASLGANPIKRTNFPRANEVLEIVRKVYCEVCGKFLPAVCIYLNRYCPAKSNMRDNDKLIPLWDNINLEELYGAIEFEKRLTQHHACNDAYKKFFSKNYQDQVVGVMNEKYTDWMETSYYAPISRISNNQFPYIQTFPYMHENFLRFVQSLLHNVFEPNRFGSDGCLSEMAQFSRSHSAVAIFLLCLSCFAH